MVVVVRTGRRNRKVALRFWHSEPLFAAHILRQKLTQKRE